MRDLYFCMDVSTHRLCRGHLQNVWTVFVVYMGVSRFGNLKLGKDHEKPVFNDMTWFSMLFCSGIGIGLYMYGVSEPMYYYRGYGSLYKIPYSNDDQFAQQAIFITLYHWGLHAWSCYILVALTLGFVAYRYTRSTRNSASDLGRA